MKCVEVLLLQACVQSFTARDMVLFHTAKEGKQLCFSCSLSSKVISTFYSQKTRTV